MTYPKSVVCTLLLVCLCSFWGCQQKPLELSIRFELLDGLKSTSSVFFEETRIGQVKKIVSTEKGNFLVMISIAPEHKDKATENSKFYILPDPAQSNAKAVVIEQGLAGGLTLKNGSVAQGEPKRTLLGSIMTDLKQSKDAASEKLQETVDNVKESVSENSRRFKEQMNETLDEIDEFFEELGKSMESSVSDEELEKLQKSLDDFISEFDRSSEEAQKKLREEVIPGIKKYLEDLREELEEDNRDYDVEKIDTKLEKISRI